MVIIITGMRKRESGNKQILTLTKNKYHGFFKLHGE
jgi:hypothetical protein